MSYFSSWFLRGLAWLVVSLPEGAPLPPCLAQWPVFEQEVRDLAYEEQWLDPGESLPSVAEVVCCCQRLRPVLANCPRREELLRWPPREEVARARSLGHAYLRTCEQQEEVEAAFSLDTKAWSQAKFDTRCALAPWEALEQAHHYARYPATLARLRCRLRLLRCLVGETRWANATLPPPVPLQHFRRMD
jgi:hypothetical protein